MKLSAHTNIDEVFADMDRFMATVQDLAVPRALNKLRDQAQTAGLKEVARIYDIGPRTMEKYVTITLASAAALEASISVKGKGFPLSEFKPVQTKRGVSVVIKGRRHLIPHAFMVRRFGKRVFARGAYGGKGKGFVPTGAGFGRFLFGRSRLPINQLFTLSPPDAFGNTDVTNAMQDRVEEQAGKVMAQEIRFARGGG